MDFVGHTGPPIASVGGWYSPVVCHRGVMCLAVQRSYSKLVERIDSSGASGPASVMAVGGEDGALSVWVSSGLHVLILHRRTDHGLLAD